MTNTNINTQELTFDQLNVVNGGMLASDDDHKYFYGVDDETDELISKPESIFDIIYKKFLDQIENNYTIEQNVTVNGDNNTVG